MNGIYAESVQSKPGYIKAFPYCSKCASEKMPNFKENDGFYFSLDILFIGRRESSTIEDLIPIMDWIFERKGKAPPDIITGRTAKGLVCIPRTKK